MKTLIVIPTYNESENLTGIVETVYAHLDNVDVLIVDDASPDGTGELADALARDNPRIKVTHRIGKLGLGTAYIEGFRRALEEDYDKIIEMDADFSHDPADLPRLIKMLDHYDCVVGSRYIPGGKIVGWGPVRWGISRIGNLYAEIALDVPLVDITSGFVGYRSSTLRKIPFEHVSARGYGFQIEMKFLVHRAECSIIEIPIWFRDRTQGQSKMHSGIVTEATGLVWRLRQIRQGAGFGD